MKNYLRILYDNPNPMRFLAARLLTKTKLCRVLKIRQKGYSLRFYPSNLSEQLWIDSSCRGPALDFFYRYVRAGDKIIDVGANIGDTALVCALGAGPKGKVWAIEPHPVTFEYLRGNIELNRCANIHLINIAVGESEGQISFGNDRRDDMNKVGEKGIVVQVKRLDDIVTDAGAVNLLKIDVEGYELPVLRGCPETLARTRCVYFEVSRDLYANFGYQIADVLCLLEGSGFHLFRPGPASIKAIDSQFETDAVENLIAVRDPAELIARTGWTVL